jgi:hypothetical protein
MSNLLAQLLQGSLFASTRPDVAVQDTSLTAIPAASATMPTVGGAVMTPGARALMCALTTGQNNSVYVMTPLHYTSPVQYQLQLAHDGRNTNMPGGPTKFDCIAVDAGTNAGKLLCWDGTAWEDLSTL